MQRPTSLWAKIGVFLNGETMNLKSILVGMVSGMVFGFVDNAGLFFGMDAFDGYFERHLWKGTEEKVRAGYGNTFSDVVGAIFATFMQKLVVATTGVDEVPLWSETVGMAIGCLLGVAVPRLILGKGD